MDPKSQPSAAIQAETGRPKEEMGGGRKEGVLPPPLSYLGADLGKCSTSSPRSCGSSARPKRQT